MLRLAVSEADKGRKAEDVVDVVVCPVLLLVSDRGLESRVVLKEGCI